MALLNFYVTIKVLCLRLRHESTQLTGRVANKLFQVAHKLVDESLPVHLTSHITIVVVSQRSGQLLIIHIGFIFAGTPQLRYHLRIGQFELSVVAQPVDHLTVFLVREKLQQKLPQLDLPVVATSITRTPLRNRGNAVLLCHPKRHRFLFLGSYAALGSYAILPVWRTCLLLIFLHNCNKFALSQQLKVSPKQVARVDTDFLLEVTVAHIT